MGPKSLPGRARGAETLPQDHPCAGCPVRLRTFCRRLDPDDLARFRTLGSSARIEAGECLFHEGDPADLVYNLTRGTVKLYKHLPDGRRQIAGFVQAGDFLGLTLQSEQAFTAEAIEPAEYCRFGRARFFAFVETHRPLAHALYRLAADELAAAREQMVVLGRKSAEERVATFLLDLAGQPAMADEAPVVDVPMTRTDMADYLGLTKETVCRALAKLRKAGLIGDESGGRIRLLRRDRLAAIAGGAAA